MQSRRDIDQTRRGDLIPRSLGNSQPFPILRHNVGARHISCYAHRYALSCTSTALRWGASYATGSRTHREYINNATHYGTVQHDRNIKPKPPYPSAPGPSRGKEGLQSSRHQETGTIPEVLLHPPHARSTSSPVFLFLRTLAASS